MPNFSSQLLHVSWVLCYAFWSLVWFVANRWINRLLWGPTKTAASGKTIRKSVAGPVNNAACPSVICWLSAVTKVSNPYLTWALLLSVGLPEGLSSVHLEAGHGYVAILLFSVWFKWVSAGSALPCFPGCKLRPIWRGVFLGKKHMTSGNGQGKGVKPKLSALSAGIWDLFLEEGGFMNLGVYAPLTGDSCRPLASKLRSLSVCLLCMILVQIFVIHPYTFTCTHAHTSVCVWYLGSRWKLEDHGGCWGLVMIWFLLHLIPEP